MTHKIALPILLLLCLVTAACGSNAPAATPTADLCSAENLPAEVNKVQMLMRNFDDYALLASNTPQGQLIQILPDMQRITRSAEDLPVPACLQALKDLQVTHMKAVVTTLMAFMRTTDAAGLEQVNAGISEARDLRMKYDVEAARLLGVTLTPSPTALAVTPAVTPGP